MKFKLQDKQNQLIEKITAQQYQIRHLHSHLVIHPRIIPKKD